MNKIIKIKRFYLIRKNPDAVNTIYPQDWSFLIQYVSYYKIHLQSAVLNRCLTPEVRIVVPTVFCHFFPLTRMEANHRIRSAPNLYIQFQTRMEINKCTPTACDQNNHSQPKGSTSNYVFVWRIVRIKFIDILCTSRFDRSRMELIDIFMRHAREKQAPKYMNLFCYVLSVANIKEL